MLRWLLVTDPDNEMAEAIADLLGNALLYIAIMIAFIFVVLFFYSKVLKEDLDWIQYVTSGSMLSSLGIAVYIVIVMVLYYNTETSDNFDLDNPLRIYITIFLVGFFLLIGPALFFIRDTFMFFKQRFLVAFTYAFGLALMYVLISLY